MTRSNELRNIPKVIFHEPESNLPGRKPGYISKETHFTIKFARAYIKLHRAIHHRTIKNKAECVRQIAINGFGIADMVSVSWKSNKIKNNQLLSIEEFLSTFKPTIRAFEIKLSDWRRGITQAHRYRYFANAAILVLPIDRNSNALNHIETFKKIHVGLWSFDPISQRIFSHFTPRPSSAIEMKHMKRAIQIMANTSKALPVVRKY